MFFSFNSYSQSSKNPRDITSILSNPFYKEASDSENLASRQTNQRLTFAEIVEEADAYFEKEYPGLSAKELTSGIFRDSKFVKYQRWKSFWKNHLNADGTLADYTKPWDAQSRQSKKGKAARCSNSENEVT